VKSTDNFQTQHGCRTEPLSGSRVSRRTRFSSETTPHSGGRVSRRSNYLAPVVGRTISRASRSMLRKTPRLNRTGFRSVTPCPPNSAKPHRAIRIDATSAADKTDEHEIEQARKDGEVARHR
jgi:hypothetical protein